MSKFIFFFIDQSLIYFSAKFLEILTIGSLEIGRELIDAVLHVRFRGSVEGAVISKQEVVDDIC